MRIARSPRIVHDCDVAGRHVRQVLEHPLADTSGPSRAFPNERNRTGRPPSTREKRQGVVNYPNTAFRRPTRCPAGPGRIILTAYCWDPALRPPSPCRPPQTQTESCAHHLHLFAAHIQLGIKIRESRRQCGSKPQIAVEGQSCGRRSCPIPAPARMPRDQCHRPHHPHAGNDDAASATRVGAAVGIPSGGKTGSGVTNAFGLAAGRASRANYHQAADNFRLSHAAQRKRSGWPRVECELHLV